VKQIVATQNKRIRNLEDRFLLKSSSRQSPQRSVVIDVGPGDYSSGQGNTCGADEMCTKSKTGRNLAPKRPYSKKPIASKGIFDQDQLKSITEKPINQGRRRGAMFGGALLTILSLPFGPIGMFTSSVIGASTGFAIGHCIDRRIRSKRLHDSAIQRRRLESLTRWAVAHSYSSEAVAEILEAVIIEFKPIADIAQNSKSARNLLKLLDAWVSQKVVIHQLWVYMDVLLQNWRNVNRSDFLRSVLMFQTLAGMYSVSTRARGEQEQDFFRRMERLLSYESVKSIASHAQLYPTEGETRVIECIVYTDAIKKIGNKKERSAGWQSPICAARSGAFSPRRSNGEAPERAADDSYDDELDTSGVLSRLNSATASASSDGASNSRDKIAEVDTEPHLKKPFFRDWGDFVNFDQSIKHKMPITLSEFDLVLQKREESNNGWDVCVEKPEITISKMQGAAGVITLRAWATVPGVDHRVAFVCFYDMQRRMSWDKIFSDMRLIGDGCEGSEILYSGMKFTGVAARDFVQYRRVRVLDDGTIVIVLRSAVHPDVPEQKGIIRAESYISGYVLKQRYDANGQPILDIFMMSCNDVKGMIPKWIINFFAPKAPREWIEALKGSALEYQQQHPHYQEELRALIEKFKKPNPFDYEESATTSSDRRK
jgi:hypothetical protein